LVPFWSVAFIVKGYETLLANPPPGPIRKNLSLVLLLGCKGFAGVTLKVKSKGLKLSSRVAVNEITGSTPTFFRVISIPGPPGLGGPRGPNTDTISIGSWSCDAETGWQLDNVTVRSVAVRTILVTMADAGLLNICYSTNNLFYTVTL